MKQPAFKSWRRIRFDGVWEGAEVSPTCSEERCVLKEKYSRGQNIARAFKQIFADGFPSKRKKNI